MRLADLGDVLLAEPALRSLRTAFPDARIDVLVPPASAQLVRLIAPDCKIVVFDKRVFDDPHAAFRPHGAAALTRLALKLRRARYERVLILHHLTTPMGARKFRLLTRATGSKAIFGLDNGSGTFLTAAVDDLGFGARHESEYALAVARLAGGASVHPLPQIACPRVRLPEQIPACYVALFPATGSYSSARTWPVQGFVEVARELCRRQANVVVLGGVDARQFAATITSIVPDVVDLAGRTTLEELAGVVSGAQAVIGGDSFVGHLAAALDRPVVSIFGPSNADAWRPVGSIRVLGTSPVPVARRVTLDSGLPCSPCLYTGFSLGRREGCPARTCLNIVTPRRVIQALDAVMVADA